MFAINSLATYVRQHAERGTCRCGKCGDQPGLGDGIANMPGAVFDDVKRRYKRVICGAVIESDVFVRWPDLGGQPWLDCVRIGQIGLDVRDFHFVLARKN